MVWQNQIRSEIKILGINSAQITRWLLNYACPEENWRGQGRKSWQRSERKLNLKNRTVSWVWCFFNRVHSLGGRKVKPYKVEVSEDRTQAQQNSWKLVESLVTRKPQGNLENLTTNFTQQFSEKHDQNPVTKTYSQCPVFRQKLHDMQTNRKLWSILRKKGESIDIDSEFPEMLELEYKEFKAAILSMLQKLKESTFKKLTDYKKKKLKNKITKTKNSPEGGD